jgi:hypothetical protein
MAHSKMVSHRRTSPKPGIRLCVMVAILFNALMPMLLVSARAPVETGSFGLECSGVGGRGGAYQRCLEAQDDRGNGNGGDGGSAAATSSADPGAASCIMKPDLCFGSREVENALKDIENRYSVSVDNRSGLWTFTALASVESALAVLQGAMGSTAFKKLYGGLTFSIGGCRFENQVCSHPGEIHLGRGIIDNSFYIEFNTLHELGHLWDLKCSGCMSRGMQDVEQGFAQAGVDPLGRVFPVVHRPGGRAPDLYAATNGRYEDWAESLAASLKPSLLSRLYPPEYVFIMDVGRQNWIADGLFGIAYEGLH